MNQSEAFSKFLTTQAHSGLPWDTNADDLKLAFDAGWAAHKEALKQADMFPGTLSGDLSANLAQSVEHPPCKRTVAGSIPAVGSIPHDHDHLEPITAEVIYAAWPVKKARGAAIKAITKAMKNEDPAMLLAAVEQLAACYAQWPEAEKQYLPMCSTFFNQERWADDRKTWVKGHAATQQSQWTKKYQ